MPYGVQSVFPLDSGREQILGKFCQGGQYISLKAGGGILQGGTQISDISLVHPGGVPTKSQIICPLSHFSTLFCQAKSVRQSVFPNQYSSLIRQNALSEKISAVKGKNLWGGNPNFQHLGWGVLRGEWKIPVLGRGDQTPMHTMVMWWI